MENTIDVTFNEVDIKGSNFNDVLDCSLARALNRMFPNKGIMVGGTNLDISSNEYRIDTERWNYTIHSQLKSLEKKNKPINYTITITKINKD